MEFTFRDGGQNIHSIILQGPGAVPYEYLNRKKNPIVHLTFIFLEALTDLVGQNNKSNIIRLFTPGGGPTRTTRSNVARLFTYTN